MAPLKVEVYVSDNEWRIVGFARPGMPGSLSDNRPDGRRDIYRLECLPDDSKSFIYRSRGGADIEIGDLRAVFPTEGQEVIAELKRGDEPYRLMVATDRNLRPAVIRFTHV